VLTVPTHGIGIDTFGIGIIKLTPYLLGILLAQEI